MEGVKTRSKAKSEDSTPQKGTNGDIHRGQIDTSDELAGHENIFIFWPNLIGMTPVLKPSNFKLIVERILTNSPRTSFLVLHAPTSANMLCSVHYLLPPRCA